MINKDDMEKKKLDILRALLKIMDKDAKKEKKLREHYIAVAEAEVAKEESGDR
jgi:hypothetical protein